MPSRSTKAKRARQYMSWRNRTFGVSSVAPKIKKLETEAKEKKMKTALVNYLQAASQATERPSFSSENKMIELERHAIRTGALRGRPIHDFSEPVAREIVTIHERVSSRLDITPERCDDIVAQALESQSVTQAFQNRQDQLAELAARGAASKAIKEARQKNA